MAGPHQTFKGIAWDAIDFQPPDVSGTCATSGHVAVAAAAGQVAVASNNTVEINHGSGLTTGYLHLSDLSVGVGQVVEKGTALGKPSCGAGASESHLHFYTRWNGIRQAIDGLVLSGWTVHQGAVQFAGCMTQGAEDLCPGELLLSDNLGPPDDDDDGIPNSSDACPTEAEDGDGYDDADGCRDRVIAFISDRDSGTQGALWMMDEDGAVPKRLALDASGDISSPLWSPDGTRIAVVSDTAGIEVIAPDGSGRIDVCDTGLAVATGHFHGEHATGEFAWSPDGNRIAYVDGETISVVSSDGTCDSDALDLPPVLELSWPSWSPDGERIAFSCRTDDPEYDICAVAPDGAGFAVLASAPDEGEGLRAPVWSLDGSMIAAIAEDASAPNDQLWIGSATSGIGETHLSAMADQTALGPPTWSPDGATVLLPRTDGNWVLDIASQQATSPPLPQPVEGRQAWSHDSSFIAHTRGEHGIDEDVWTAAPDGSQAGQLTNAADSHSPAWRPCPDLDGDEGCNFFDSDDDADGCSDVAEAGTDPMDGGMRDELNFWDFFDVPSGPSLLRDGAVSGPDFFAILGRIGSSGNPAIDPRSTPDAAPAYHTAYDRSSPPPGGEVWDSGAADGTVAGTDLFLLLAQFGHECS
jgi:Tol biopolymer transport system component